MTGFHPRNAAAGTCFRDLRPLFDPISLAVIGATDTPSKIGYELIKNIVEGGFQNPVYPVNPKLKSLMGMTVYRSVRDVPSGVELAVVAVPASQAMTVVRECSESNIRHLVIITAGFGETVGGSALEQELTTFAKSNGLTIVGPNSAGIVNTTARLYACIEPRPVTGSVAFISQSGAFGGAVFNYAKDRGVGFSKFVSIGNACDLNMIDIASFLANDPETKVIASYIEGLKNAEGFVEKMKSVTRRKPVIVVKVGRTAAGAKAARSHTGSLAGSDAIFAGACKQARIIRADDVEQMVDYALAFLQPFDSCGPRIGILSDAGGPAVAAADVCEENGLRIPEISTDCKKQLASILPSFASCTNPVDMTATLDPNLYQECIRILFNDPMIDGLILTITGHVRVQKELARAISGALDRRNRKPLLVSWTAGKDVDEGRSILLDNGIPVYLTPERAARAMAALVKHKMIIQKAAMLT